MRWNNIVKKSVLFAAFFMILSLCFHVDNVSAQEIEDTLTTNVRGKGVFGFWQYSEYDYGSKIRINEYTGAESNIVIPAAIAGKPVMQIDSEVFEGNENLISITIPPSVTYIGEYCFQDCTNLVTVSGMSGVKEIGHHAFKNCEMLSGISFGNALTKIHYFAFENCKSIKNISFGSSLEFIGEGAFLASGLTSVVVPSSVELNDGGRYGVGVFENCESLTAATLYTYVSGRCFQNCTNLKTATIQADNEGVGYAAFSGCSALSKITINDGKYVTAVQPYAFYHCTSLTDIDLRSGIRYIYNNAFEGCSSLRTVSLKSGLIGIDENAFLSCSSLEEVEIPNTVNWIKGGAFSSCSVLKKIKIPNSVVTIGYDYWDGNYAYEICSNDVKIECYEGSSVQSYAEKKGNPVSFLQAVPSTSIKFSAQTVYMNVDDFKQLQKLCSMVPSNTTDAISWETSYSGIASVNEIGEVTAKGAGTATITATATSGYRATINVVVSNKPSEIYFSKSSVTITVGQSVTYTATVEDRAGKRPDIIPAYTSSNPKIATVNAAGKVTGISPGTVTITAKTGNLSDTYKVTVVAKKTSSSNSSGNSSTKKPSTVSKSITFSQTIKTVVIGRSFTQQAKLSGLSGNPVYSSSNPSIASVSNTGNVKGIREGIVIITAKSGIYKASYTVQVVMATVKKSGKVLTITTIPKAKIKVSAKKAVLGRSSKSAKANGKGIAKIKFKKKIKGNVKIRISKSGYPKKTIKKKF